MCRAYLKAGLCLRAGGLGGDRGCPDSSLLPGAPLVLLFTFPGDTALPGDVALLPGDEALLPGDAGLLDVGL